MADLEFESAKGKSCSWLSSVLLMLHNTRRIKWIFLACLGTLQMNSEFFEDKLWKPHQPSPNKVSVLLRSARNSLQLLLQKYLWNCNELIFLPKIEVCGMKIHSDGTTIIQNKWMMVCFHRKGPVFPKYLKSVMKGTRPPPSPRDENVSMICVKFWLQFKILFH